MSLAPYLTLLCGVAILAVVVRTILVPIDWGNRTTKYDTPATATGPAHASAPAAASPAVTPPADPADGVTTGTDQADQSDHPHNDQVLDERDAWDALTHGDDPS